MTFMKDGVLDLIIADYLSPKHIRTLSCVNHTYFKKVAPKVWALNI